MDLKSYIKKPTKKPLMITIAGDAGMGKTSLAATFPNPILIPIEDGTSSLVGKDIAIWDKIGSYEDVLEAINLLSNPEHGFKTVIFDSVTQLSTIIEREILERDGKAKSINQALGGYGAGYSAMARAHAKIREQVSVLQHFGMHVVFIAHANVEKINPPDQEEYTRYSLRLHKDSIAPYHDNVDVLAFIKQKTIVSDAKAMSTGERIVSVTPSPSHISKNRLGIKEDLPFIEGQNPFAKYL